MKANAELLTKYIQLIVPRKLSIDVGDHTLVAACVLQKQVCDDQGPFVHGNLEVQKTSTQLRKVCGCSFMES